MRHTVLGVRVSSLGVMVSSLAACNFPVPKGSGPDSGPGGDGGTIDAMSDAPVDGPVGMCTTWTPVDPDVMPCAADLGTKAELILEGDATLNTDTGMLARVGGTTITLPGKTIVRTGYPTLRIINLSTFQVNATRTLTLTGSNAVLFVVHGDATIAGTITASAALPVLPAVKMPGADSARCDATRTGGTGTQAANSGDAGGGGGGGALGGNGGLGGSGFGNRAGGTAGAADAEHVPLRGGCAGGRGGDNEVNGANEGGLPGGGGGAFAISARGVITVATTASLRANGAPGLSGQRNGGIGRSGGGGGGAGGTIALDGATVTLTDTATLCAKGGGGGEGSSDNTTGNRGQDVLCNLTPAGGGSGGTIVSGDGGDGGSNPTANGFMGLDGEEIMNVEGGGGGGGGGAGKILLRSRPAGGVTVGTAVLAPAPITLP